MHYLWGRLLGSLYIQSLTTFDVQNIQFGLEAEGPRTPFGDGVALDGSSSGVL